MNKLLNITVCAVAALSMTSCVMDSPDVVCPDRGGNRLTIQLAVNEGTRANPVPGDDGDGREYGSNKESAVSDLNIFIYNQPGGLKSVTSETVVKKHLYATEVNQLMTNTGRYDKVYEVDLDKEEYEVETNDHILLLANYGKKIEGVAEGTATVSDLANMIFTSTWTDNANPYECEKFLMANAKDDDGMIIVDPNDNTRFGCTVDIERMSSRIDWMFNTGNLPGSGDKEGCLVYPVVNYDGSSSATGSKIYMEKILPVNTVMPGESDKAEDRGVYMLKHLTTGENNSFALEDLVWCQSEGAQGVVPTRYVAEPRSVKKTDTPLGADLTAWYGASAAATLKADKNYENAFENDAIDVYARYELNKNLTVNESNYGNFNRYMTLTYCHENTQPSDLHLADYITGLAMQCTFRPGKVYSGYNSATGLEENTSYETGSSFWRFTSTKQEMKESEAVYFDNETAANAYSRAFKANENGLNPDGVPGVIERFDDARCYYNVWLRHANTDTFNNGWDSTDPHETFPMEFGIVRNNIYRIGVSFTGPGSSNLTLREPWNVRFRIFVRKWNIREFPEVQIPLR